MGAVELGTSVLQTCFERCLVYDVINLILNLFYRYNYFKNLYLVYYGGTILTYHKVRVRPTRIQKVLNKIYLPLEFLAPLPFFFLRIIFVLQKHTAIVNEYAGILP